MLGSVPRTEKKVKCSVCFWFSLFHDPDEGHKEFLMEVFENQSRSFPGGDFKPAEHNWTDSVRLNFFSYSS